MIQRNERGKITVNSLDVSILFGELFEHCQTPVEVDWLHEILESHLEGAREEKLEDLGYDEEEDDE